MIDFHAFPVYLMETFREKRQDFFLAEGIRNQFIYIRFFFYFSGSTHILTPEGFLSDLRELSS